MKKITPDEDLILIFGRPNSGKGTMGKVLAERYGLTLFGTGDICRRHKAENTELWQEANAFMMATRSTLWPTETLDAAFSEDFIREVEKGHKLQLDGYLRKEEQAESLANLVQRVGIKRTVVLEMNASHALCVRRAEKRKRVDDDDIHIRLDDFDKHSVPALAKFMAFSRYVRVDKVTFSSDEDEMNYKQDQVLSPYAENFIEGFGKVFGLTPNPSSAFC